MGTHSLLVVRTPDGIRAWQKSLDGYIIGQSARFWVGAFGTASETPHPDPDTIGNGGLGSWYETKFTTINDFLEHHNLDGDALYEFRIDHVDKLIGLPVGFGEINKTVMKGFAMLIKHGYSIHVY